MGSKDLFPEVIGLTVSEEMPRTSVRPDESDPWEVKRKRQSAHNQTLKNVRHLGKGS